MGGSAEPPDAAGAVAGAAVAGAAVAGAAVAGATRWLDPLEMQAWRHLLVTHGRLFAVLDDELQAAHGLSLADYEVLVQLSDAPGGALRMAELAERSLVSPSGLTRRLDGLVAAGLVCRRPCPEDRRGSLAALSPAGRAKLAEAAPTHLAGVRRHLVDRLDRGEIEGLLGALARVVEGLGGDGPDGSSCGGLTGG
ncbi:MAG: MarR family winged helix-turn-helix transcriptional regulator [Acidimicrobiales bacterium]